MHPSAATAAKAERERIGAILALPEARGREDEARRLAMTTDLSVDQVRTKLAAEVSALWAQSLASRGMKVDSAAGEPSASPWDAVLRSKGLVGA